MPIKIWEYNFKLQICSDYGPFYFKERQMIHGRKNATKNPWTSEETSSLQNYFKNNISSLTVQERASLITK